MKDTIDKTDELSEIFDEFLGEFHKHKCSSCNGEGCINCRKTGMGQSPCPLCDGNGIAFERVKTAKSQLEALLNNAHRLGGIEMANLYGTPVCENLHHAKKHQHSALEACPVVEQIAKLTQLRQNIKEVK